MRLRELLDVITGLSDKVVESYQDIDILGIAYDSRKVKEGYVFFALSGTFLDGHNFIKDALKNGAAFVIGEKNIDYIPSHMYLKVDNARRALSEVSARFYNHPAKKLKIIGVTGTNGKTTTTFIIDSILQAYGKKTALLGTIYTRLGDEISYTHHTTLGSLELNQVFSKAIEKGIEYVVMEVSSHALSMYRVWGVPFLGAIFTNIANEHFELHKNFENYLKAKTLLFESLSHDSFASLNADDSHSSYIMGKTIAKKTTFGLFSPATFYAKHIRYFLEGVEFSIFKEGEYIVDISTSLGGIYNVYNILGAVSLSLSLGIPLEAIARGVKNLKGVPGRYEVLNYGQKFNLVVDFAHNYHGLYHILITLRPHTPGRLITVFGCGGERDKTKRPVMAKVVSRFSDYTIISTDNPRSEDPMDTAKDAEKGIVSWRKDAYEIILDRKKAIEKAISMAREGDTVLLAGKGPEEEQVYKDRVIWHNDKEVARRVIMGDAYD